MTEEQKTRTTESEDREAACAAFQGEEDPGAREPWLPIETKLVTISIVTGIVALAVLATLVNIFLLGGH